MSWFDIGNTLVTIPLGEGGYAMSWIEAVGTLFGLLQALVDSSIIHQGILLQNFQREGMNRLKSFHGVASGQSKE